MVKTITESLAETNHSNNFIVQISEKIYQSLAIKLELLTVRYFFDISTFLRHRGVHKGKQSQHRI